MDHHSDKEAAMADLNTAKTLKEELLKGSIGHKPLEGGEIWHNIEGVDPDLPLFSIGGAAALLEVHPRTLRIYEKESLVTPKRRGQRRYYSLNDLQWITCLRSMIHDQGISIAGIKKLLRYTACWNIVNCPLEKRKACTAFRSAGQGYSS